MDRRQIQILLTLVLLAAAFTVGGVRYFSADSSDESQPPGVYISRRLDLDARQEEKLAAILEPKRVQSEQIMHELDPQFEARMDHFGAALRPSLTPEQTVKFDDFWAGVRQHRKKGLPLLRVLLENCGAGSPQAQQAPASPTEPMAALSETHENENDQAHKSMHHGILNELRSRLQLSPAQLETAEELLEQSHREILPLRRELRRRIQPITADLDTRVSALLTAAQIEKWETIRLHFVDREDCPAPPPGRP